MRRPQHARGGQGARGVAGQQQIGIGHKLLESRGSTLAFVNPGRFVRLAPGSETSGVNPAGMGVRGASVANEDDATASLTGDAFERTHSILVSTVRRSKPGAKGGLVIMISS